jgi:hypothetical protein
VGLGFEYEGLQIDESGPGGASLSMPGVEFADLQLGVDGHVLLARVVGGGQLDAAAVIAALVADLRDLWRVRRATKSGDPSVR